MIRLDEHAARTCTWLSASVRRQNIWDRSGRDFSGVLASSGWLILSGDVLVKQASLSDGRSFYACPLEQDRLASAEVDVCRRQIV